MENKTLPQGLQAPDWTHQVRLLKAAFLAVLAIISFGTAWQVFGAGLSHPHEQGFWLFPLLLAAVGIGFLALLAIVNAKVWIFWATNLGILIWYLAVLPKDWYIAAGGAVFFFLSFLFERRIRSDEKTRADFALNRIVSAAINLMVYALLIAVGFNVYHKINRDFETHPERFYGQIGRYAARGLEYVPQGLGDFDPDQTFEQFVVKQAQRQDPQFQQVPPAEKNQVLAELKKQLAERFKINISGNPLLGDVVAGAAAERIQHAAASHEKLFPVIFAIIIVALLRTVAFIFIWLTSLIVWLLFRVLLLVKFFRIEKVQVEVNKLQI
ncbi:MAG: hypothetical protein A3J07_04770 [Candidatus Doudnabacteria bacterium RIFCSPLOWO2_02_FULL_49_13]|nr:MAG: hypothetical protein A3B77_01570 [Candidatus Doudnabacteria bacterium RIFCSPHIGHO2_02_FULL_49_24]OGE96785.1 MAG: hypothetical protein A2990_00535 [Candidatus Doudnabacteria bacterium RIFCSPLOWO2_01_FULL_49_40]OGF03359.1 MAG: hypothetical protein A3J07_04770 [Candidatus Doudnabacteria bacterium RIFCSPLOWO2_02_FULL_49_13]